MYCVTDRIFKGPGNSAGPLLSVSVALGMNKFGSFLCPETWGSKLPLPCQSLPHSGTCLQVTHSETSLLPSSCSSAGINSTVAWAATLALPR